MTPANPICVDLDGTLIQQDSLVECARAVLRRSPWDLVPAPLWIIRGKAYLKHNLAAAASLDAALFSYHHGLLEYLRQQARTNRPILLVTGADRRIAQSVAGHLGIFDGVLSSDGETNLTGAAKAQSIRRHLDGRPFAYAGNSSADIAVWRHASSAIVVGRRAAHLRRRLEARNVPIEMEFPAWTA